jgi:hypothetical protein
VDTLYKISVKNIKFKIVRIHDKIGERERQDKIARIKSGNKKGFARLLLFFFHHGKAITDISEVITRMKNTIISQVRRFYTYKVYKVTLQIFVNLTFS